MRACFPYLYRPRVWTEAAWLNIDDDGWGQKNDADMRLVSHHPPIGLALDSSDRKDEQDPMQWAAEPNQESLPVVVLRIHTTVQ